MTDFCAVLQQLKTSISWLTAAADAYLPVHQKNLNRLELLHVSCQLRIKVTSATDLNWKERWCRRWKWDIDNRDPMKLWPNVEPDQQFPLRSPEIASRQALELKRLRNLKGWRVWKAQELKRLKSWKSSKTWKTQKLERLRSLRSFKGSSSQKVHQLERL